MIAWSQAEPKPIIIEGRTARGGFGIFRDGDLRQPLTVNWQIAGGTADGGDHTLSPSGSVTIKRGRRGVRLPAPAADDAAVEGNETLVVGLTPGEGYSLGSSSSAPLTVGDDDAVPDLSLQGLSEEQEENPGAILAVGAERMALSLNLAGSVRFGSKAILSIASGADKIRVWSAQSGGQLLLDADRPGKKWKGENLPSTLWIEAVAPSQSSGDIALTLSFYSNATATQPATDTVKATAFQVDLAIDSNNDGSITAADDPIEEDADKPGKIIAVNDDDNDGDGIVDFLDGFDTNGLPDADDAPPSMAQGEQFVPLVLELPLGIDLSMARMQISYDGPDVALALQGESYGLPETGRLRLWTKDGGSPRDAGNIYLASGDSTRNIFLPPGGYGPEELAKLGISETNRSLTLYVEAIRPSAAAGDQRIEFRIWPTGEVPLGPSAVDAVRMTSVKVKIQSPTWPYNGVANLDNLLGSWPADPFFALGDILKLQVNISPLIPNLPGGWQWQLTHVQSTAAANNQLQISVTKPLPGTGSVEVIFPGLGITRKVWINYPDVGTQAELEVALLDPINGASVGLLGNSAANYANALMVNGMDEMRANAIQHAYWNALITMDIGSSQAALFTTAHEFSNRFEDNAFAHDSVMDLHNNGVGRSIADNITGSGRLQLIQAELNLAAQDGRLWIIDTQTQMVIKSDGTKIFK